MRINEENDRNDLVYRKASVEEYPLIIALQTEIFCGEQKIPEELIDAFLANEPTCWCAEQSGRIVGSVAAWQECGEIHVGRFVVLPEMRGQKIGTRLLNHAVRELFDSGAEVLCMEARDTAVRILLGMGGMICGESFEFYLGNVTPMKLEKKAYMQKHAENEQSMPMLALSEQ